MRISYTTIAISLLFNFSTFARTPIGEGPLSLIDNDPCADSSNYERCSEQRMQAGGSSGNSYVDPVEKCQENCRKTYRDGIAKVKNQVEAAKLYAEQLKCILECEKAK